MVYRKTLPQISVQYPIPNSNSNSKLDSQPKSGIQLKVILNGEIELDRAQIVRLGEYLMSPFHSVETRDTTFYLLCKLNYIEVRNTVRGVSYIEVSPKGLKLLTQYKRLTARSNSHF